jgi:hypothetical protein
MAWSAGDLVTAAQLNALQNAITGASIAHEYATKSASTSTTTGTFTTVTGWAGSTVGFGYANGIWTVNTAGHYEGRVRITWPNIASPTGQRVIRVIYNGSTIDEQAEVPNASVNCPVTGLWELDMQVGDTISIQIMQSQGSTQSTMSGIQFNWLGMHYCCPI